MTRSNLPQGDTPQPMEDRRIEVQSAVARTLAEIGDPDEAGPALLESIGGALGWELGAMWEIAEGAGELGGTEPAVAASGMERRSRPAAELAVGHRFLPIHLGPA